MDAPLPDGAGAWAGAWRRRTAEAAEDRGEECQGELGAAKGSAARASMGREAQMLQHLLIFLGLGLLLMLCHNSQRTKGPLCLLGLHQGPELRLWLLLNDFLGPLLRHLHHLLLRLGRGNNLALPSAFLLLSIHVGPPC